MVTKILRLYVLNFKVTHKIKLLIKFRIIYIKLIEIGAERILNATKNERFAKIRKTI